jgi:polysulfide reductase chain C
MEPGLLKSADWPLLIDIYFFLGGLAGGAFLIATVASFLDPDRHRDVIRVGYYVALLAIIPAPIILVIDLGLPTRFLHMMFVSKPAVTIGEHAVTLGPFHLKPMSPMNVGAWALLVFGLCAFVAALDVWLVDRGGRSMVVVRRLAGLVGSVFGLFIAAYPGVLLGATARPLFVNAHWLGALFVAVGASTGGAAIALILSLKGSPAQEALARLMRFTAFALILQAVALILFVVTVRSAGSAGLGRATSVLLAGPYSVPFWLGAVVVGLVVPLILQFTGATRRPAPALAAVAALLMLVGGFLVKYVIIAAGQVVSS